MLAGNTLYFVSRINSVVDIFRFSNRLVYVIDRGANQHRKTTQKFFIKLCHFHTLGVLELEGQKTTNALNLEK